MADSAAAAFVGLIDVHYGGTAYAERPTPYPYENLGLHLWHTENNLTDGNNWVAGIMYDFQSLQEYLIEGNANAWNFQSSEVINAAYWGPGGLLNDHVPSKTFYAMGNFSRYVRPGWHLYGATEWPNTSAVCVQTNCSGLSLSFYRSPNTKDFSVIVLNNDAATVNLNVAFNSFTAPSVTPITTSTSLNLAQDSAVTAGSGFSYTVPAQSLTTFIGTAN
jgi:glucuronoarabinoxylan endo-1,4-beta-xylanase